MYAVSILVCSMCLHWMGHKALQYRFMSFFFRMWRVVPCDRVGWTFFIHDTWGHERYLTGKVLRKRRALVLLSTPSLCLVMI